MSTALNAKGGASRMDFDVETFVAHTLRGAGHDASEDGTGRVSVGFNTKESGKDAIVELSPPLRAESGDPHMGIRAAIAYQCHGSNVGEMGTLRKGSGSVTGGHDASEDGTGRGVPLVPVIAIQDARVGDKAQNGKGWRDDGVSFTLDVGSTPAVAYQCHGSNVGEMGTLRKGLGSVTGGVPFVAVEPVAFTMKDHGADAGDISPTLRSGGHTKSHANGGVYPAVTSPTMGVRRLTPREMERLQGFPDDYTAIPWRGKGAENCPDGPRAKALGNSMAVPVMRWIGERIALVDAIPVGEAVDP